MYLDSLKINLDKCRQIVPDTFCQSNLSIPLICTQSLPLLDTSQRTTRIKSHQPNSNKITAHISSVDCTISRPPQPHRIQTLPYLYIPKMTFSLSLPPFPTSPSSAKLLTRRSAILLSRSLLSIPIRRSRSEMDTFFLSHGSPMMAIDEELPARQFLQTWQGKVFQERPTAVLMVSAHWDTSDPCVNVVDRNSTIHDFYNFPKPMYELKYPTPGAPKLAQRVRELLTNAGFKNVKEDKNRGLDHGAWVPLMLMYPETDIPVCQLSVQSRRDGTHHYNMGRALRSLRDEGVLIIGSGSATHNLRIFGSDDGSILPWAKEYDDVNHYEQKAPHAKTAHPWPEHFYPLHVAMGAAGEEAKAELIHRSWEAGALSYASYRFSTK
ncbi:hypothetical protein Sjap_021382 [Stephania japonica]|uniref:Extradiol ring-cleavage dioxygenase class III enzyme subunit B domain-containing protein n=1 Tax=Stephania japonica TaxID=461633 RepID=A0AAP0EPG4_9MAGN